MIGNSIGRAPFLHDDEALIIKAAYRAKRLSIRRDGAAEYTGDVASAGREGKDLLAFCVEAY